MPRGTNLPDEKMEKKRKVMHTPQDHGGSGKVRKHTKDVSMPDSVQNEQGTSKGDQHDGADHEESDENYIPIDRGVISAKRQKDEQQREKDHSKLLYYPMQESLAQLVVGRIEDILHIHHKKSLSDFKNFDFQIYTAPYNNLKQQTLFRLMNSLAGCFPTHMYDRLKDLKNEAGKRMQTYVKSKEVDERFAEVQKNAADEPDTLFLIVADEAHWGRERKHEGGAGVNDLVVEQWSDEDKNVFVLLVTATAFNLKTNDSKLDIDQLAARKTKHNAKNQSKPGSKQTTTKSAAESHPEDESVYLVTKQTHGEHYTNTVTEELIRAENLDKVYRLHHIRWTEGHEIEINKGIVMKLLVIVEPHKTRWLKLGRKDEHGFHLLEATDRSSDSVDFRIKGNSTDRVTIQVEKDGCEYQLLRKREGLTKELRTCCKGKPKPQKYKSLEIFKVHLEFGEDILMLQVVGDTSEFLHYDQKNNMINLKREPQVSGNSSGTPLCPLEYSFLVDYTREIYDIQTPKQYLSLNFYFNTMRNSSTDEQLLRCDDEFSNMLDALCNKKKVENRTKDDYLAAEYAYYIVLIDEMRKARLQRLSLKDILTNPGSALGDYTEKREDHLNKLSKTLDEADKEGEPTCSSNILSQLLENLQCRREEQLNEALKKKKISLDVLVEALISGLFHLDEERLATKCSQIKHSLGSRLEELNKEFINKNAASQFDDLKRKCLETSETFKIIDQVVKDVPRTGLDGKMVVVRVGPSSGGANETAPGNRFYNTLCYARSTSTRKKFYFEVIRDFGNFKISNIMKDDNNTPKCRMHSRLQPKVCEYIDSRTLRACTMPGKSSRCDNYEAQQPKCKRCGTIHKEAFEETVDVDDDDKDVCNVYDPEKSSLKCIHCKHYHRTIKDYSDCNKLPCILILVKKGRLGSTFPESLSAIDLRIQFDKSDPFLTTLIQELGRLCRYTQKPQGFTGQDKIDEYKRLPYALISSKLRDLLLQGLKKYAVFCGIFDEKGLLDRSRKGKNEGKKTQRKKSKKDNPEGSCEECDAGDSQAAETDADYGNIMKHNNRVLLEAEPQIGKTGVYLKIISVLRQRICPDVLGEDEESNHDSTSEDEDEDARLSKEDDGERWQYPYWKEMENMTFPTYFKDGKYGRARGSKIVRTNKLSKPAAPHNAKKISERFLATRFETYRHNDPVHVSCKICYSNTECILKTDRYFGVKVSVPNKHQYLELLMKLAQGGITAMKSTPPDQTLTSWIFIPSHDRSLVATVNYRHTMVKGDDNQECYYVQILVVREEDFEAYHSLWGSTHAIIELPRHIEKCEGTVGNGIGYARLFVQKFAEHHHLPYVFMLDDNIKCVREVITQNKGHKLELVREGRKLCMQEVPLFRVLKHLESQFLNPRPPTILEYEPSPDKRCKTEELYTGPADQYAALGCLKERQNTGYAVHPHKKTNVYSLVLLNVDLLKEKGIQYKPIKSGEDLELYKECNSMRLWVCKYNRFAMRKLNLKSKIAHSLYYWQDTDTLTKSLKSKEVNDDYLFSGIQERHPPLRTEEWPSRKRASAICMRFREVKNGSTHLLIYTGEHGELNEELKDYFRTTKGIGGYSEHLVMLDTKLCRAGNLKTREDFRSRVVDLLFDDVNDEYQVFTSHQIHDFEVPHVVVLINGRIRNPCDRAKEPNACSIPSTIMKGPQPFIMLRVPLTLSAGSSEGPAWAITRTPAEPSIPSSRAPGNTARDQVYATSNQSEPGTTAGQFPPTRMLQLESFEVFNRRTQKARRLVPRMKLRKTEMITLKVNASESRIDGKSLEDLLKKHKIKS